MKNFIASLSFILFYIPQLSAGEIIRDYPVEKITDSTYVIVGPRGFPSVENQGFMNNPAWVITDKGVIVIDPGSSVQAGRMVIKRIKELTSKPVTHVFATHIHGDHWLGNHAIKELFPDAIFMGHPEMIKKAHQGEAESWLSIMSTSTNGFTDGTVAVIPETNVIDKQTIRIHGKTFEIYAPGKAHSGNDIMIKYVDDSVLFAGDNVLYTRIARMDDGTFKGNIDACQLAIDLDAKYYVPGHGPVGGKEVVTNYRDYLKILYQEVARLYEEGLESFEMKEHVLKKLTAYSDWVNFNDEVGKHISLALLEVEKSSF